MTTTVYCQECGTAGTATDAFCDQCGHRLSPASALDPVASSVPNGQTSGSIVTSQPSRTSPAALHGIRAGYGDRARSKAWIYYLILAIGSILAAFAGKSIGLLGAVLFGAYSYYIYNGGSLVIWFW